MLAESSQTISAGARRRPHPPGMRLPLPALGQGGGGWSRTAAHLRSGTTGIGSHPRYTYCLTSRESHSPASWKVSHRYPCGHAMATHLATSDSWFRRLHLDPLRRLHSAPPRGRMTPRSGSTSAVLAASSWQALASPQGRTSSLRCGRSTLTCSSSPAIRQQSRKATIQECNPGASAGRGHFEPTPRMSISGWGHPRPPRRSQLKAP